MSSEAQRNEDQCVVTSSCHPRGRNTRHGDGSDQPVKRRIRRRVSGAPTQWTDGVILQTFKFCNIYRAADRVSQYMVRDVCYHDNLLHDFPLMGDFMSHQTAIGLDYSDLINFSENEFTRAGPGALRGIKKCFTDLGDHQPADIVMWMVENQEQEMTRLGLPFNDLWGRPLHAIDCQRVVLRDG